ncbi:type IV secretory system conjugative DNA transfer family protein [Labedaea rhizosphaerae]|uniref:type IV secretory system conjugative DNA transfer family protein n=1 Tax=Labedaea rhizosphaerae TaxID=598644 RepID=UPI001414E463|nr:TraM recognition domain-containing protein [Labedaea rhizosphaerae]
MGAIVVALVGVPAAAVFGAAIVSWLSGRGLAWPHISVRSFAGPTSPSHSSPVPRWRWPIEITWPASAVGTAAAALALWVLWLRMTVVPLRRSAHHQGPEPLVELRRIRTALGRRAVRRSGRLSRPELRGFSRLLAPTAAFGIPLGRARTRPTRRGGPRLWIDFEQRIRVVGRTGWGKSLRVLIPIIRRLPGPAVISSIEPQIFEATVTARQFRRRPTRLDPVLRRIRPVSDRWPWLRARLDRWTPIHEFPIAVVDFSAPERRYAAGYPQVRWPDAITGCRDYEIALRRATALVMGMTREQDSGHSNDNDRFFRTSATQVLAAWLHAAALGNDTIDAIVRWLRTSDDPRPTRILEDHPDADPVAALNIRKHLDTRAQGTTSGVERYLLIAMNALASDDARALCGAPGKQATAEPVIDLDLPQFIRDGGTLYLLADPNRIERVRPLLAMFAAEVFLAAEHVALSTPQRRLQVPFFGVLDELRAAVPIPNLPYIATVQRKYGISYVYSVASGDQEDALFGAEAAALRAAAGITIVGGIDIASAQELTDRAGPVPTLLGNRSYNTGHGATLHGDHSPSGSHGEQVQLHDALTIADQQDLADGEAIVVARGIKPFLAWFPSILDRRRDHRALRREVDLVRRRVAAGNGAASSYRRYQQTRSTKDTS